MLSAIRQSQMIVSRSLRNQTLPSVSSRTFCSFISLSSRSALTRTQQSFVLTHPSPSTSSSFRSFSTPSTSSSSSTPLTPAEITERVLSVVKGFEKIDASKVTAASHFGNDLGLDSLDAVELVMAIEDEFGVEISDKDADKIVSVQHAIDWVKENHGKAQTK